MILYEILPNKTLKPLEDENTYITENLISSVHIKLPSTFGDYPVKELTAELRFYFPEGDYMAYTVDTQQARPEVPITNDITEKPQTLSVMLFFYKGGNVIGKTNSVDKVILDAHLKGEPLTPRAEADEKIREQQEKIAEQANTITEQAETIGSQGEQITELSGEVTELTTENMRLENQHEQDFKTIGILSGEYVKPKGKIRFIENQNDVDIKRYAFADIDVPEPSGTIEITQNGNNQNVKNYEFANVNVIDNTAIELITGTLEEYTIPQGVETIRMSGFRDLRSLFSINFNTELKTIQDSAFRGCSLLQQAILPHGLTSIDGHAFELCSRLRTVFIPNTLTLIVQSTFSSDLALETVIIENGFNCNNLNLSASTRFTAETIVACLEALADRTGQTAYTITFGTTNLNKLTAEQKAIATNKNWNLA